MKAKVDGEFKTLYVKALDSMPVGTEVDYDGQDIPVGWEQVEDKGEVYSTTETRVGTWIDGKPLYRKVIEVVLDNTQTYSIQHNISNVDIIFVDAGSTLLIDTNNNSTTPFWTIGINNDNVYNSYLCTIQSVNRTNITIKKGTSATQQRAIITLKYTKTTDEGSNA